MTLELKPEVTASPEDMFGRKGEFFRDFSSVDKFFRVADHIDEVRPFAEARGFKLTEFSRSAWVLYRDGQTLQEAAMGFFTDRVDGFVWIADREVQKFEDLFREGEVG